MTPFEYSQRMDQILRYVGGLLVFPDGTPEWTIGRTFALLPDSERIGFLRTLVNETQDTKSRAFEIGWDLRAIIEDWPESGAAA
ncbi:hypothetical protein ACIP5Y_21295 [Nocardia sp. NPDC088792]|uniref:hypothetical protein n=1 Tax=Nocardia sp. NPDC088792 TaxID=3364332 RepID=UPI0037F8B0C6